ncbi:MAG: outer membrane lipoprotein carrier protein LolA [Bdellovibrionales bacterium RIFOXYC1_FULL_54_43]|nr:MAG: outer membrane lipoprotein carrier protein LolA [Bdellovibrionales bacterium RIFOXYC1_FULL_54_43]OFZ84538.1 MAG: outer membrane lipoprotein carrier protein LolA [Bdellovibrionales bacterium RIFOXYD1_FULL_55_31]
MKKRVHGFIQFIGLIGIMSLTLHPVHAAKLPRLLQEVEAKYARATTLEADFSQINVLSALKRTKTSSGHIQFKRPNKIRWETLKPDPNLLVSDGKKFWFYTPPFDEGEQGQVIEKKTSEVQTKFAHALLSGSFSIARNMKVKQEKPSRFALIPKKGTAGTVIRAEIEVDPGEKLIKKVTLLHRDGNRSEISLSAIKLGEPLEDRLFSFVPPPNTDIVKE